MNKIKANIKDIYKKDDFPFIVVFIVYEIFHMFLRCVGDDAILRQQYKTVSIWHEGQLISYDYFHWSSRIIVNCCIHILLRIDQNVWALIDSVLIFVLLKIIAKLFVSDNARRTNYIISVLFVLYPFYQMGAAGWVATSVTYLWVLVFALIGLIPIRKVLNNESFTKMEYIVYSLAIIFGGNQEQMLPILLACYGLFIIYMIVRKRMHLFLLWQMFLCGASLIFILTTPGNKARSYWESIRFPDFSSLSLIDKLQLGFSSTMYELVFKTNLMFILFCVIIFLVVCKKYKEWLYRLVSIIPLLCIIMSKIITKYIEPAFPKFSHLINPITKYGVVNVDNYNHIVPYFQLLIMCIVVSTIVVSLYLIFGNTLEAIFVIYMFLVGLASRVMLGFSPTIWASGERTFIFLDFIMIIICIKIYNLIDKDKILNSREISYCERALGALSLIAFIQLLNIVY